MLLRSENKSEEIFALALTVAAVALRLLPHPENFTPMAAVAFFAGSVLSPRLALTVPLAAMIASDLVIGLHDLFLVTWGSFMLTAWMGIALKDRGGLSKVLFGTLAGSLLYFVITNLAVFLFENMYPKTAAGLVECFMMALPFLRGTLVGDLCYGAALFGAFAGAKKFVLRVQPRV